MAQQPNHQSPFDVTRFDKSQAVTSLPASIISDRLGAKKVIALGVFIFAMVYGALGFSQSVATLLPIYIGFCVNY